MDFKEKNSSGTLEVRRQSQADNLPEVYYPPNFYASEKEISPVAGKSSTPVFAFDNVNTTPPTYQNNDGAEERGFQSLPPRDEPKRKAWLGMPLKVALIALLVLLVIIGIVGGVMGALIHARNNSRAAQNATSTNSTNSTLPQAKFSSIASTHTFNQTYVQVFYLEKTSVKASIFDGFAWNDLGDLAPSIPPKNKSPLAAVSFLNGANVQLRIYFFDAQNREIELAGSCTLGGLPCKWSPAVVLQASGIANHSSLTAIQWNDPINGNNIRTMWENTDGKVAGSVFTRNTWTPDKPIIDMLPGSPLVSAIDNNTTPFILRAWYRSRQGALQEMKFNSRNDAGWDTSSTPINIANTSALSVLAPMAVAFAPQNLTLNATVFETDLFFIQNDKRLLDVHATNGTSYSTAVGGSAGLGLPADNVEGAVSALAWRDPRDQGLKSGRLYYARDGKIQEMVQIGDIWRNGSVIALV